MHEVIYTRSDYRNSLSETLTLNAISVFDMFHVSSCNVSKQVCKILEHIFIQFQNNKIVINLCRTIVFNNLK